MPIDPHAFRCPFFVMSPSTDPVESNRQLAVDRLDHLDRLAQSVDGQTIPSHRVYDLAVKVVEKTCGFAPSIALQTATGVHCLVESGTPGEPNTDEDPALTPLASVPVAGAEFIVLQHPDAHVASGADWQSAFLTSVTECCCVAFLKQFYANSASGDVGGDESRSWWPMPVRVGICLIGLVLIAFIPVKFRLPTEGTIQPAINLGVFAPAAGELTEITVVDGTKVEPGQVLASIENPELRLQAERLRGELLAAQADLASTRLNSSDQNHRRGTTRTQAGSSSTKVAVLRTRIKSLQRQVALIEEILDSLVIRAGQSGRVVIDDQQSKSVGQAVLPSQQIMRLADDRLGYQAIVRIPAKSYGYLEMDHKRTQTTAYASLRLRSDPSRRFEGSVSRVSDTVQVDEQGQSTIDVFVDLQNVNGDDVRIDAPLIGHVYVGRRTLGFVVFRPIIEFIRENSW